MRLLNASGNMSCAIRWKGNILRLHKIRESATTTSFLSMEVAVFRVCDVVRSVLILIDYDICSSIHLIENAVCVACDIVDHIMDC